MTFSGATDSSEGRHVAECHPAQNYVSQRARSSVPLTPPKIPVATEPGRTRIGIGGVPGFAVDGLNGFQFFLRKRFVHRRKFLSHKRLEFASDILQLFLQRVDAPGLIISGAPLI